MTILRIMLAAALALGAAGPALAQTPAQAPARVGNIWDGQDHEINPAQVRQQEKAAGLTTPAQAQRQTDEVEQLEPQILKQAQHDVRNGNGNGIGGGAGSGGSP